MIGFHDREYSELINHVLKHGTTKPNRTGVDTIGVFSYQMRFDLRDGTIPLLTTKKVHTKSIIHELLWMMSGDSNIKYLNDNGVRIWDEWADENGDLGPVYGAQWRKWPTFNEHTSRSDFPETYLDDEDSYYLPGCPIDQIAQIVDKLKNNPLDRRLIVSAWNVAELPNMKLPPCHYAFQFYTRPLTPDNSNDPQYELSLMLNQRSCDIGLGVPFNIVQYSLLLRMMCEVSGMIPGEFIWNGGDTHIYVNHIEALKEQALRTMKPSPTFKFARKINNIDDFKYEDFVIENYVYHPAIKMDVAV